MVEFDSKAAIYMLILTCVVIVVGAERKRQKIARASDNEMRKRAQVRESRAARLNTALWMKPFDLHDTELSN